MGSSLASTIPCETIPMWMMQRIVDVILHGCRVGFGSSTLQGKRTCGIGQHQLDFAMAKLARQPANAVAELGE